MLPVDASGSCRSFSFPMFSPGLLPQIACADVPEATDVYCAVANRIPFPGQGLKEGLDQNLSVAFLWGCTSSAVSHLKSRTEPEEKGDGGL